MNEISFMVTEKQVILIVNICRLLNVFIDFYYYDIFFLFNKILSLIIKIRLFTEKLLL